MSFDDVMMALSENGNDFYVKIVDGKGKNSCRQCLRMAGRIYRYSDPDKPVLPFHPNCECRWEKITDPATVAALDKMHRKQEKYYANGQDFDKDRDFQEKKHGPIIDDNFHSHPSVGAKRLSDQYGTEVATRERIKHYEGYATKIYFDGKNIPTIGVGANLTEDYILDLLVEMRLIKASDKRIFKNYKNLGGEDLKRYNQLLNELTLTAVQMNRLFAATYKQAEKDARKLFDRGSWVLRYDENNTPYRVWDENADNSANWNKLPDAVKVILIDLAFNLGINYLRNYKKFLQALKKGDYRRAGIELVDSKDYRDNINNSGMRGVAIRRRDAAIELSELAG